MAVRAHLPQRHAIAVRRVPTALDRGDLPDHDRCRGSDVQRDGQRSHHHDQRWAHGDRDRDRAAGRNARPGSPGAVVLRGSIPRLSADRAAPHRSRRRPHQCPAPSSRRSLGSRGSTVSRRRRSGIPRNISCVASKPASPTRSRRLARGTSTAGSPSIFSRSCSSSVSECCSQSVSRPDRRSRPWDRWPCLWPPGSELCPQHLHARRGRQRIPDGPEVARDRARGTAGFGYRHRDRIRGTGSALQAQCPTGGTALPVPGGGGGGAARDRPRHPVRPIDRPGGRLRCRQDDARGRRARPAFAVCRARADRWHGR